MARLVEFYLGWRCWRCSTVWAWKGLPHLIRAARNKDVALAQRPRRYIERRYNRVFTKPTAEERRQIEVAFHDCAGLRDEAFLEGLRQWLRSW
jgi:hypothetical protein